MFEKDPLFREESSSNLAAYRAAKRNGAKEAELRETLIACELAELDAAIVGMDAASMEALRDWADLAESQDEEESRVVKRHR